MSVTSSAQLMTTNISTFNIVTNPCTLYFTDTMINLSSNSSSLDSESFSDSTDLLVSVKCHIFRPTSLILIGFYMANIIIVLPLCIFILPRGLKLWFQKGSAATATSHSDFFTYHLITMELINVFNCVSVCCGIHTENLYLLSVGEFLTSFIWHGQTFFQMLTCLEHYLAVVHPIIYLSLRKEKGIRLRNIIVGCVWLLSIVEMVLMANKAFLAVSDLCLLVVNIAVISFGSVSVLRVLNRPGPGKQTGSRNMPDQSKQRAFYTIVTILGVLVLRFVGSVLWTSVDVLKNIDYCLMMAVGIWINLPSSLVLPLLFLQREGKLLCCKNEQVQNM